MDLTISYLIPVILVGWAVISLVIIRKKRESISYSTPKSRRLMKRIDD